jgi:hypothetical protein
MLRAGATPQLFEPRPGPSTIHGRLRFPSGPCRASRQDRFALIVQDAAGRLRRLHRGKQWEYIGKTTGRKGLLIGPQLLPLFCHPAPL